ncbi:MAG: GNAT family N-acetyltransferase [Alphaproteobacteria bacterium]|nr:GNAT family N-acetyltransferase [Alphaproteobacteria bacterium]
MQEFPKRIDCGDFELVKPDVKFDVAIELFNMIDKNRDKLTPWLGWVDYVKTPEDEFAFVESVAKSETGKYFIVVDSSIVGMLGFVQEEHRSKKTVEIGYWLDKDMNGRGIMTRAVKQLMKLAFEIWNANRVEIQAAVENIKSRAIPERLGFNQDGILRQREIVREGEIQDVVMYSKLKAEWEKEIVK